jgi:4-azaleucine resistance transporter AzlC
VSEGFRRGLRAGAPFGVAVLLVGISFGVVARDVIGSVAAIVMSAIVFSGAAQFAAVAVLAAAGSVVTAVTAGVLLSLRFVPMGLALAPSLRGGPLRRAATGQAIVDASWALASKGGGRFDPEVMLGATAAQYPAWLLGTVIGVLAGDALGDPRSLGLDALFPAFFVALLMEELRNEGAIVAAALGAAIALVLIPVAPPGVPVIAACLPALLGLRRS